MKKPLLTLVFLFILTFLLLGFIYYIGYQESIKNDISNKRKQHAEHLKNSPFTKTLKWDKKTRKKNGLPPNRYFEQMWELTINPSTGKLDEDELTNLREQLKKERESNNSSIGLAQRNPGDAANAWEERGPNNVGGRTRVIMFDPNDASNNIVYAGGVSGGLWRNTNITSSSSTWSRVANVPGNLSVTSITVDPRNSNIWYVGTGEQYTAGDVVGNGVYVTTDGGTTWNPINIPPADNGDINFSATNLFLSGIYYVNDVLAWDNGSSTELFVAVGAHVYGDSSDPANWLGLQSAGLYHSTNGGSTWNRIESSNMQHTFSGETYYYIPNDLEVSANNTLWMGSIGSALGEGGGRVFSSTNGNTWTEAAASPLTDSNRVELEPSASNANKIYALTQGVSSPVHIYETTNAFSSITSLSLPSDADTGIASNDFCRGQAFYDLVIEVDPADDDIVYVGGIDLFKSTNGGSSWSQLSHWYGGFGFQEVHADQHSIAFGNNSSSRMMFGNDGGIYYSGNSGNSINVRNNNYNVTQFVKAGIGPDGNGDTVGIFSAGAQDNGTQAFRDGNVSPGINSSEELSDGDGFYTFVDKDGDFMIATYVFNVIYRFNLPWDGQGRIDGGATTISNSDTTGDFVNQMGYDDDANRLLSNNSSGSSFSIRSINVGSNNSGTLSNSALSAKPTAFRASPFANNTWYVGTANGSLLRLTSVTNSSASWTTITTPFVGSVSSVRFGTTANDLIVTMHNYGVTSVWYSSDAGSNWTSKEGNLPNIPVRDFLLNPLNSNEAIIATQIGVWETSDFNASNPSWSQAYNGMSDVSVTSLDYWDVSGDDTNNKVMASTYGRGVFTGSFTASTVPDTQAPTAPTNLASSNISDSSVDLSWTASTDNIGVTSYDVYQDESIIANVTSGTTYQVNGLTANTNYSFTVVAKDAAGNTSNESNQVNITTTDVVITYCDSASTNVNDEYISRVQLNTIDNSSGAQFYSDFTSQSTSLTKNSQYTITITPTWTGTVYSEGYSVWIDYNNNGDFTDSGEQVFTQSPTQTTPVSGSFTIPSGATETTTRMRVSMKYDGIPTSCETFQYGEVEDYTVNIEGQGADTTAPVITLNGSSTINLDEGDVYTEQGAIANDNNDGDITANIVIGGDTVNTNSAGTYVVTYNVSDAAGNPATQVTRIVNVIADTIAPVITLNGSSTINLNVGDTYTELGSTAIDNKDGDITANIVIGGDTVNTNNAGTYVVTYNVSDASGNAAPQVIRTVTVNPDTAAPVITLNGSSTINLLVGDIYTEQGATATDNIDGDITASIVVGGDTVNTGVAGTYVVTYNVSDAAGNNAAQVIRTINVTEPTSGCSEGISSFPYSQGFENTLGAWTQSSADDLDWIVDSNGTPSGSTGPSSASEGTFYVYVEVSGDGTGYPNKQAILNSPCFDLSSVSEPNFSFKYHQFGSSDMGTLDVEASDDDGATWTSIWNSSGNLGDSWQSATINLAVYAGGSVQLRFNRVGGGTWQADIAIDDVSLIDGEVVVSGCSGGISSFPYTEGFENTLGAWTQSGADDLNWTVDANGTPSGSTGPSSAVQGSFYIYVEASGNNTGYPNKRAIINSPCFDLSAVSSATFNFNYHQFGSSDMGTIDLEASNDDGASWTSIWNSSGNLGNSWQSASVSLSAYAGGSVQLRFNRLTGSTWQADIAIDNINLSTSSSPVVAGVNGSNPVNDFNNKDSIINTLSLFPNPVKGSVLNIKTLKGGNMSYRLINTLGQVVKIGDTNKEVIVESLEAGVYFIEVTNGDDTMMKRFIKE